MLERQIQFTLLETPSLLQQIIGFPYKLIAAYLDISNWGFAGEIDFVLQDESDDYIVVELEQKINSNAKVEHVVEQVERYFSAAQAIYGENVSCLIIAEESPSKFISEVQNQLETKGIPTDIRLYQYADIECAYLKLQEMTENLFGIPSDTKFVKRSVASFGQLNEIFGKFKRDNLLELSLDRLKSIVCWKDPSAFSVRLRICKDLGLIDIETDKIMLTPSGQKFRDYTNFPYRIESGRRFNSGAGDYLDLSEPQKQILRSNILRAVRIGPTLNNTVLQIIAFLQYVILFRGRYIVKNIAKQTVPSHVTAAFQELIQRHHSLSEKAITDIISWSARYCVNLGLVTLVDDGQYYRAVFTEEGSRFYRLISDQLNILREERNLTLI